ncbi:MAG: hypothetical protein J5965_16520 [Aeriscardovia sp.]|nr:hypothetical protein [Aeriscardovia sp.]
MKRKKWCWIDSTNISVDRDDETDIRPMPEMAAPRVSRYVKPSKRAEDEENSLVKRLEKNERFARETELDWAKVYTRQTYVQKSQIWEGRVLEIHEETFVARLTDCKGVRMPRLAKIKKSLINRDDWEMFFQEGFEFEWVFKDVVTNGTFSRKNEIRFTPVTRYLPDEVEEFVRRSMSEFSYMLKNDD